MKIVSTLFRALVLTALLVGLLVAPAIAAPSLGLTFTNNPTTLPRTDEGMSYTATVKNTASENPEVGNELTCTSSLNEWGNVPTEADLAFRWLRNGVEIPGATTKTYVVTPADEGMGIQCVVTGTVPDDENIVAHTPVSVGSVAVSLPAVIINPEPAAPPPSPTVDPRAVESRPVVSNAEGDSLIWDAETRICHAPTNWTEGTTFTYRWLRNGVPIPGATSSSYTPVEAEDFSVVLQCEVIGKTGTGIPPDGGTTVSISGADSWVVTTSSSPHEGFRSLKLLPNNNAVSHLPGVAFANATSGPITLEVELPPGSETFPFKAKGAGWACSTQLPVDGAHGRATCTRSDPLAPGDTYPPVQVAAHLGTDAPAEGTAFATVSGGGSADPAGAQATYTFGPGSSSFGMLENSFLAKVSDELGNDYTTAGGHPFSAYSTFGFNVHHDVEGVVPTESVKDVVVAAPRGFVGNALAAPELCPNIADVLLGTCPPKSAVGEINVYAQAPLNHPNENLYPHPGDFNPAPIYSIEPEFGQPAQFAFGLSGVIPYTFVPELRADEGYAISFRTAPILRQPPLYGTDVTLCDFGAKLKASNGGTSTEFVGCRKPTEAGANPMPLITNPTRCSGPPPASALHLDSWQRPDEVKTYFSIAPQITDCDAVEFEPEAELQPTNHEADSPTGLGVEITMPIDGVLSNTGISQANLDSATVTFPKGMTINPATADGLGSCSLEQVKLHSNAEAQCPESSKVGTVEVDTPLIRKTLTGSVYVAKQKENPFNATLGLYMVFSSARDGVTIKVAGQLTPDPVTGQLVSSFTENPEAPFSRLALNFTSGPRAPLINPPKCGTYAIHSEFSPWSALNPANPTSDEIVSTDSRYKITKGPGGRACPDGSLQPKLNAGLQNPTAGAKSPFVLSLSREDGTQHFTGLEVTNPKGLTAYLKGVATCPDSALGTISPEELTGAAQIANPSCPAQSLVGTAAAGSGAGPLPFYVKTGRVYLAGPYKGAPVSLAIVTPAVAGPYDLGNVLVRTPLYINPETAQVTAKSDPIPTSLHGIALDVRDIRVALDRPNFTAAPTSCEPMSIDARVSGEGGSTTTVSNRFQVGGCESLGFRPKLNLRLFGGTKRGSHPRLRATLTYPEGGSYANIAAASVALPHSEFLDQAHIGTICTRVQFAAKQCPAASVYGKAEATTPLLDHPVSGPVYLRSSSNPLPDLVAALRGPDNQPIEVVLDGRIDSVNGGIRSSFDAVPDQPVSSFTLNMQGGKKGLLVNSRDICKSAARVNAEFTAQNGKTLSLRPALQNSCKKAHRGKKHHKRHHKRRR